jgi:hypothetical protein
VLEVASTGTNANANFSPWTLVDIITGCGVFDRYEITGDAATMALLTWPEPGVTLLTDCLLIDDCLAIRVDTSAHIELSFTLSLYPQFGNPVSTTFDIFVNQCLTATLTMPAGPSDLVLARSAITNNIEQIALEPDYLSLFVSDFPVICPVRTLSVYDNAGATWTNGDITLVNELTPLTARLDIDNDTPFVTTVRVQAYIALITSYFELNVEVCGDEVLTADSLQFIVLGYVSGNPLALADAVRYHTITEATFTPYFTFGNPADPCVVTDYYVLDEVSGPTLTSNAQVDLIGSFGSYEIKIDQNLF